jgi:protein-tyrosine phosphatase
MKHILVVCTGNVCRSPMAAGLIRARLAESWLDYAVDVQARGVYALEGQPASPPGVALLAERGIDIRQHLARTLQAMDLQAADVVLVMEEFQRRHIFYQWPEYLHKVWLFSELAGEETDILDPYRQDRSRYEAVLGEMERILDAGWPKLLARLGVASRR